VEKCARSLAPMLPPAPVISTILLMGELLTGW
jgi:hypothetical protein